MLRSIFLALSVSVLPVAAQTGNGSIQGSIKDPTGASVPGAKVTVEHAATARKYENVSTDRGAYLFPSLPVGEYKVTAEAAGLDAWRGSLILQTGQTAVVEIVMKVSGVAIEITVTDTAGDVTPILNTTTPTLSNVVERARIEQLPLNGRMFQTLIQITTPGIEGGSGNARVYGLRTGSMEYSQDGASLNGRNVGGLAARPPGLDTINEFRVETSVSSSKFNRPASAIVSTKSGTNQIHGALFYTMRNNGFGVARRRQDFYSKPPQLIRNEYGASLGGPVYLPKIYDGRNRTFFFAAWEKFRLASGTTLSAQMPTMAMRNGDYNGLSNSAGQAITLYDPWTTGAAPTWQRVPFPGNRMPISRRSPFAAYLYSVTPEPSLPNVNPVVTANSFFSSPNDQNHLTTTFRGDHRVSDKDQIFGRYSYGNRLLTQKRTFNNTAPITTDNLANYEYLPVYNHSGVFSWTRIVSPTFFVETVVTGASEDNNYNTSAPGIDRDVASELKLPNPFGGKGLPDATSLGFGNFIYQGIRPRKDVTRIISGEQNYTKIHGKHTFEFGGRYRQELLDVLPDQEQNQGSHAFNSLATALFDTASSGGNILTVPRTGHDSANFFLGVAAQYSSTFNRGWYHLNGKEISGYFQDNWKVRPNLTLSLGVRYEFFSPVTERDNVLTGFDLNSMSVVTAVPLDRMVELGFTTRAIVDEYRRVGVKFTDPKAVGLPNALIHPDRNDFSPRGGFAYTHNALGRTWVVRGGYGMYKFPMPLRTFNSRMRGNPPTNAASRLSINNAAQTPDGLPNYGLRSAPTIIAGLNSQDVLPPDFIAPFTPGGFTVVSFDPNQPTTTAHEWNMSLETVAWRDMVLRIGYVGTAGRNLDQWLKLNDAPNNYVWFANTGEQLPTGTYANTARRPLDKRVYGGIDIYRKAGFSNYNGLEFEAKRRYKNGISYQFFYVFANAMGTGNIDTGNGATNAIFNPEAFLTDAVPRDERERNRFLNYRRDTEIPHHRLRWNFLADLPFGKGKRWLSGAGGVLNRVAGGWQLAGFGSYTSRYWSLPVNQWGYLGDIEIYRDKYPISDCRSGACIPGYLYWNGYIPANRINSVDAQGRPNGVMGVPANYKPSNTPVWPTPASGGNPADPNFAQLETNNMTVRLKDNSTQRVALDTNNHPWRQQYFPAPWIFNMSASVFKTMPITERVALRFNADFFNVFNTPGNVAPGDNGIQSLRDSAQDPRQVQFTLRLTW